MGSFSNGKVKVEETLCKNENELRSGPENVESSKMNVFEDELCNPLKIIEFSLVHLLKSAEDFWIKSLSVIVEIYDRSSNLRLKYIMHTSRITRYQSMLQKAKTS
ncbi:hypothetical protein Trydic_g18162 [Trypoxylus dichotomus]